MNSMTNPLRAFKINQNDKDETILLTRKETPPMNSSEFPISEVDDGYHKFSELYHCRHILFAALCKAHLNKSWKSKLHSDGTMYDGMFIAGIDTEHGQYTFHVENEYWDLFEVNEILRAPQFDGHTLKDIESRLLSLPSGTVNHVNQ